MRLSVLVTASALVLAVLAGGPAAGEEPPWRFSVLRTPVAGTEFVEIAGGSDLNGDGIDDIAATLRPTSRGSAEDAVAAVVSGGRRDSWVADRGPKDLVIRGIRGPDGAATTLCKPKVLPDVTGDGIDELLLQLCSEDPEVPRRVFVVHGSHSGVDVSLGDLGDGGFEVDLGLTPEESLGATAALEDVGGAAGIAAPVYDRQAQRSQTRVYRLAGRIAEPWAVFEGSLGVPLTAGDFFGGGGSDLLVADYEPDVAVIFVLRVPSSPDLTPRRPRDLGADEAARLGRFGLTPRLGFVFSGIGDVNADGFDDVVLGSWSNDGEGFVRSQSVVLGGPVAEGGTRREFVVYGSTSYVASAGDVASVPAGDVNGDGLDDVLISSVEGFYVLHGSRSVNDVDLNGGGDRSTFVEGPAPVASLAQRLAPIGEGAERAPRIAAIGKRLGSDPHSGTGTPTGDSLYVFEPPRVPLRLGVAFDGDASVVGRVDGDPGEVPEASAPSEAAAVAQSLAISRRSFAGSLAEHVVLASANSFADALAATPLLGDGPLLLTPPGVLPQAVAGEIDRVVAPGATVYVMGGPAAVSETVTAAAVRCRYPGYDASDHCYRVRRLAGGSRIETAAAVARLVGASLRGEVAVARAYGAVDESGVDVTGAGWADAVTAGGWAAATRTPMLLTPTDQLHPAVADVIADLGITSTVVLGGTAAVSEETAAELPEPRRFAGRDRSETAVAIAVQLWRRGADRHVLIDGYRADGWTAGLPAAALAADGDAPLLLHQDTRLPAATAEALRACPPDEPADVLIVGAPSDEGRLAAAVLAGQHC